MFTKNQERLVKHHAIIEFFNGVLAIAARKDWLSGEPSAWMATLIVVVDVGFGDFETVHFIALQRQRQKAGASISAKLLARQPGSLERLFVQRVSNDTIASRPRARWLTADGAGAP